MSVNKVVPFFAVKDMAQSVPFYIEGLGFEFEFKWEKDGLLQFCNLQIGGTNLMLQQFKTEGHDARQFSDNKGEGVSLCFFCDDAVGFYRDVRSRGIVASEPQVGNGLWVTSLCDPDGYELQFQSPADAAEGSKLSEVE